MMHDPPDSSASGRAASRPHAHFETPADLGFRSDFPGGNGLVSFRVSIDEGPTIVELTAPAGEAAAPLWFHTQLTGLAHESVHLRLANALQMNGDHRAWAGNTIVVRDGDDPWRRAPLPIIEDDAAGVQRVVYPLAIRHHRLEVAWCFPYQREDLRHTVRDCRTWLPARIGRTSAGRVIERYRHRPGRAPGSSSSSSSSSTAASPRGVYLICGQAANETAANWVLDGFMRAVSLDDETHRRTRHLDFWAVPFVDVDGHEVGQYGRGWRPSDFELAWRDFPQRTEVRALMLDLERWAITTKPALVINVQATSHEDRSNYAIAHGTGKNDHDAMTSELQEALASRFGSLDPPERSAPREAVRRIAGLRPGFENEAGAWAAWARRSLDCPALTFAVSHQGTPDINFEIEHYHQIGLALARALGEVLSE